MEFGGLVLRTLPDAVETLKKCNEAIGEVKKWLRYKKEAQSLIRTLETEKSRLEIAYEKLLIGVVPPSQIEAMIADPGGRLWKEADTQKKVRGRLWRSYVRFEEIMNEMGSAMAKFERKIAPLAEPDRKVSMFKRTSFSLNRANFAGELDVLKDAITSLEQLTTQNMELEPARRVRSQARLFSILRDLSRSIFHALCSSLGCACVHDISLRLEFRSAENISPGYDDEEIMRDIPFQFIFSARDGDTDESSCREELIVKAAPPEKTEAVLPAALSVLSSPPSPGSLSASSRRKGKMNAVSFNFSHSSASSTSTITKTRTSATNHGLQDSISALTMGITSIGLSNFGTTVNLCEKLRQTREQVESYGTILDNISQVRRQYAVYPALSAVERRDTGVWSTVSLKETLECSPPPLYARLRLALVISSSILQLHNTPWLSNLPSSADVFLLKQGDYTLYNYAYVVKKFPGNNTHLMASQKNHLAQNLCNPTLLHLGILLIELILGKTFDSLRPDAQQHAQLSSDSRTLADLVLAQTVLQQIRQTSANYGTAVGRCISGDIAGGRHRDLDDQDFRQEVYSSVVSLIKKDLEYV